MRTAHELILALALCLAAGCAVSRKAFYPHEELTRDAYEYMNLPRCRDSLPERDWLPLQPIRREDTFKVIVSGTLSPVAGSALELTRLSVSPSEEPSECEDLSIGAPKLKLKLVTAQGDARWIGPSVAVTSPSMLEATEAMYGKGAEPFCFALQMRPDIQRVEIVSGGRVLLSLQRPDDPRVRAQVHRSRPQIAVAYEDDAASYAIASMRIESGGMACQITPVAQRSDAGFLGLGSTCWSMWSGHFESVDEIDPGLDHIDYFYPQPIRATGPAQLVVSDLFYRTRFPLWFSAECGRQLPETSAH
jgi:hypothetical protein